VRQARGQWARPAARWITMRRLAGSHVAVNDLAARPLPWRNNGNGTFTDVALELLRIRRGFGSDVDLTTTAGSIGFRHEARLITVK